MTLPLRSLVLFAICSGGVFWSAGFLAHAAEPPHKNGIRTASSGFVRLESHYWEHNDYSAAVKAAGLSRTAILSMGLNRFRRFHDDQYTKREGRSPSLVCGDEQADLIFMWVQRQENLRHLFRLSATSRQQVRRLEHSLTQLEYAEVALRLELSGGGSAWLAFMRCVGIRHETLLSQLIRLYPPFSQRNRQDRQAHAAYLLSLARLKQTVDQEQRRIDRSALNGNNYKGTKPYQEALNAFKQNLDALEQETTAQLPDPVYRPLSRYLPDCWWENFEAHQQY